MVNLEDKILLLFIITNLSKGYENIRIVEYDEGGNIVNYDKNIYENEMNNRHDEIRPTTIITSRENSNVEIYNHKTNPLESNDKNKQSNNEYDIQDKKINALQNIESVRESSDKEYIDLITSDDGHNGEYADVNNNENFLEHLVNSEKSMQPLSLKDKNIIYNDKNIAFNFEIKLQEGDISAPFENKGNIYNEEKYATKINDIPIPDQIDENISPGKNILDSFAALSAISNIQNPLESNENDANKEYIPIESAKISESETELTHESESHQESYKDSKISKNEKSYKSNWNFTRHALKNPILVSSIENINDPVKPIIYDDDYKTTERNKNEKDEMYTNNNDSNQMINTNIEKNDQETIMILKNNNDHESINVNKEEKANKILRDNDDDYRDIEESIVKTPESTIEDEYKMDNYY